MSANNQPGPDGLQIALARLRVQCEWNRIIAIETLAAVAPLLSNKSAQSLAAAIQSSMAAVDQALIDLPDDSERLALATRLSAEVRAALRLG